MASDSLIEPEPLKGQTGLELRAGPIEPTPLHPRIEDVVQGEIAACPIAAVMVALAHARPPDLDRILGRPQAGPVLSKRRGDQIFRHWSDQVYDVTFPGRGPVTRITPYVYFEEQKVKYASTPGGPGWPSYIEKAYAVLKSHGGQGGSGGDYSELDLDGGRAPTLNDVMKDLIGKIDVLHFGQQQFFGSKGTSRPMADGDILAMARQAGRRPTVGPSIPTGAGHGIEDNHGYAILGVDTTGIRLRNPWGGAGATFSISVAVYRQEFQGVFQAV